MLRRDDRNERVFLDVEGGIGTIFLNRPGKRNALDYGMWTKLKQLLDECATRPEVRVVVLRSVTEEAFSAGADIGEFVTMRKDSETSAVYNRATEAATLAIQSLSKPTIAMLQGFCVGGGAQIAVACDLRFAGQSLKMGITPAKLGVVYGFIETKMLVDLVGPSRAKDLLLSGRLLEAQEASQVGLVDFLVPDAELEETTFHYIKRLLANADNSMRGTKTMVLAALQGVTEDTPELAQLVAESFDSREYQVGVAAFLEKRRPNFQPPILS